MTNVAILVGNTEYQSLGNLSCCHDDLVAMKELLDATEKFPNKIELIENSDADTLKSQLRTIVDTNSPIGELFFYFSGHGCLHKNEFYCCATNFDQKRSYETGISNNELHTILKLANPELVVKVIDACNSGTLLVKSDGEFIFNREPQFKNFIQISSYLESQSSLTGKPLSPFTEKFRSGALRKKQGPVYYIDIVNSLKDEFLLNNDQIPFFVSQGTGREQFVDDAKRMDALRKKLAAETDSSVQSEGGNVQTQTTTPSLQSLLSSAEENIATPEKITSFVDTFFNNLIETLSEVQFTDYFDVETTEHSDFVEPTAKAFIIRVLIREQRSDEFVTATIKKEKIQNNPLHMLGMSTFLSTFAGDEEYREVYNLQLNCDMKRAQISIAFTPKYRSLSQLVLVVTCVPSLESCYVFEIVSQHKLKDFGEFQTKGKEVVRRWYKFKWTETTDGVVAKIKSKLDEIVREHLKQTERRLKTK